MSDAAKFYAENQQAFIYTHLGVQALVIVMTGMMLSSLLDHYSTISRIFIMLVLISSAMYLIVVLAMEIVLSVQGRPACPPCEPCTPTECPPCVQNEPPPCPSCPPCATCEKCPTPQQIAEVCVLTAPSARTPRN